MTRFDLKTVPSNNFWVGIAQYDQTQVAGYIEGVYNFGQYGGAVDPKAAIIPTILSFPSANLTVYATAKFYNSHAENPAAFENFTASRLIPVADSYALQPLSDYIASTDALQPLGLCQEVRTLSSIADRKAFQVIHDAFISGVAKVGGNPQGVEISKAPFFWMVESWTWTDETCNDAGKNNRICDWCGITAEACGSA